MEPSRSRRKINSGENEGYTILELAVVVTTLSILAAIAMPNINKFTKNTRIDSVKAKLNSAASFCLQDYEWRRPFSALKRRRSFRRLLQPDGYKYVKHDIMLFFVIEGADNPTLFITLWDSLYPMGA